MVSIPRNTSCRQKSTLQFLPKHRCLSTASQWEIQSDNHCHLAHITFTTRLFAIWKQVTEFQLLRLMYTYGQIEVLGSQSLRSMVGSVFIYVRFVSNVRLKYLQYWTCKLCWFSRSIISFLLLTDDNLVIISIVTGTYVTMVLETIVYIKKTEEVWIFEENLKQVFVSKMTKLQIWSIIIPLKEVWS